MSGHKNHLDDGKRQIIAVLAVLIVTGAAVMYVSMHSGESGTSQSAPTAGQ